MNIKKTIKFIELRKYFFVLSLSLITIGLISMGWTYFSKGDLNWGIDFSGGLAATIAINVDRDVEVQEVRDIFAKNGFDTVISKINSEVLIEGAKNQFFIKMKIDDPEHLKDVVKAVEENIRKPLTEKYGDKIIIRDEEGYEPTIGRDLKKSAGMIVGLVIFLILIYIAMRFQFKFGIAAIICLIHDSLIVIGISSLMGRQISISLIVAILTLIGYSLNDTIIVFDRIRENSRNIHDQDYIFIINKSITQTLNRTIITSLTVELGALPIIIVSALLGIDVLFDIVFFIAIGIVVGTYSSIFVASPLLYIWENMAKKYGWGTRKRKTA